MADKNDSSKDLPERDAAFRENVRRKEERRIRARRERDRHIWFGLGMFGLVGWAVAIPAVIGIAAGVWIDSTWPGRYSWTLMGLFAGVALGCINAWYWVKKESGGDQE